MGLPGVGVRQSHEWNDSKGRWEEPRNVVDNDENPKLHINKAGLLHVNTPASQPSAAYAVFGIVPVQILDELVGSIICCCSVLLHFRSKL